MSVKVRNQGLLKSAAQLSEWNKLRLDLMKLQLATKVIFHNEVSSAAISVPVASDLPTAIVVANTWKATYNADLASAVNATTGLGAHTVADGTNTIATANATDLPSLETLLNACKAAWNAHRVLATVHFAADATNASAAAAATDLGTSITLANDLVTQRNAHVAGSMNSSALNVVTA